MRVQEGAGFKVWGPARFSTSPFSGFRVQSSGWQLRDVLSGFVTHLPSRLGVMEGVRFQAMGVREGVRFQAMGIREGVRFQNNGLWDDCFGISVHRILVQG